MKNKKNNKGKKVNFSPREWTAIAAGAVVFFASVATALSLPTLNTLEPWVGWSLAVAAIAGMLLFVGTTVRALLQTDTEGIERQEASRAALIAVLFIVVAGFGYALLEAFAGMPRMTAAVPAVAAGLVWMIAFVWDRPQGDV